MDFQNSFLYKKSIEFCKADGVEPRWFLTLIIFFLLSLELKILNEMS